MTPRALSLADPDAALAALLVLAPVAPCRVAPAQALGRVLASPIVADTPVPLRPIALCDGWAVAAAETDGASPYAPAPLGTCARVTAGQDLPTGTDAVLPAFDVSADGPVAMALQPVAPGESVRRPGEDIAEGSVLRAAGQRLGARDLPALAALGVRDVLVRMPRLAWITTNDEGAADPVHDTLLAMLAALAPAAAFRAFPPVPDDPVAIAAVLRDAAETCDAILLAGGTREGADDRRAAALRAAGALVIHGIGVRPGTNAGFGAVAGRPALLLPGRVEDALAAWLLLGRPLLARLTGEGAAPPLRARLAGKVASMVGMAEFVPVRLEGGLAEPLAVGAMPPGVLAAADAVLLVPPGTEGHDAGTEVTLLPL